MPSYSWRREHPSKAASKEHSNTSLVLSSSNTLLLGPVQRKDGGNYVCEAYNRHGSVNTTVFLDVMCKYSLFHWHIYEPVGKKINV